MSINLNLEFLQGEHVSRVERIELDHHNGWLYFEFDATHRSIFGDNPVRQLWMWTGKKWCLYNENYGKIVSKQTGRGIAHSGAIPEKYSLPSSMRE